MAEPQNIQDHQAPQAKLFDIRQIMPANGWHAEFQHGICPLACWALVKWITNLEELQTIVGCVHIDGSPALLPIDPDDQKFIGYISPCELHPDEESEVGGDDDEEFHHEDN